MFSLKLPYPYPPVFGLGCIDMFAKSIARLKECGWYWGPLSWEEASIILRDKLDGSFLVRDSSDDR